MASDTPPRIAAAILAGGMARRMGGANKAGLRIGNERIIDRQLRLLRRIADPVVIIAGSAEPFQELEITVVPDALTRDRLRVSSRTLETSVASSVSAVPGVWRRIS